MPGFEEIKDTRKRDVNNQQVISNAAEAGVVTNPVSVRRNPAEKGIDEPYGTTNVVQPGNQQTLITQPEQTPVVNPNEQAAPSYLFDWGKQGTTLSGILQGEGKDTPIQDVLSDYFRWGHDNNQYIDYFGVSSAIKDMDVTKSKAQNTIDAEKQARKEKWDQVGNVLSHLGNAIGTLAGGGMASLDLEDPVKFTERQRRIANETRAIRNAYNKDMMANIWKMNEDRYKANKNAADIGLIEERIRASKSEDERKGALNQSNIKVNEARTNRYNVQAENDKMLGPEKVKTEQARQTQARAAAANSYAHAKATNKTAYGNDYKNNRHKIFSANKRKYPADAKQFMEENNIHSWDRKNWTPELIDQFNAFIADKEAAGTSKTRIDY